MKSICVNFVDPDLFFIPLGTLPWQLALGKICKICKMNFIQHAGINGFEYRNSDLELLKRTIFATFCAILVQIGPLTPDITQGVSVPFGTRR